MLDQVLGGVVGARRQGGRVREGSGINKVLMLLLAAGAAKVYMDNRNGSGQPQPGQPQPGQPQPGQIPAGQAQAGQGGGGLSDILGGVLSGGRGGAGGGGIGDILGNVLGGGRGGGAQGGGLGGLLTGAGGVGGLGALVEQFQRNGQGSAINNWVSTGPNQPLPPQQLAAALGPDVVEDLARESGMDREQMLDELSETLPDAVDQLTPDGTVPPPERLYAAPGAPPAG